MTREEELDWLCRLRSEIYVYMPKEWLIPMNDALDMAIKALEQEPNTDMLDSIRSEIVTLVDTDPLDDYRLGYNFGLIRVVQIIDKLREESKR